MAFGKAPALATRASAPANATPELAGGTQAVVLLLPDDGEIAIWCLGARVTCVSYLVAIRVGLVPSGFAVGHQRAIVLAVGIAVPILVRIRRLVIRIANSVKAIAVSVAGKLDARRTVIFEKWTGVQSVLDSVTIRIALRQNDRPHRVSACATLTRP